MLRVHRLGMLIGAVACLLGGIGEAWADEPANWPAFRGADARGIADGSGIADAWSESHNVAWKTDIPGKGWSSPIVWGDRLFLTTVVNTGETEAPKKGLYFGGERQTPQTMHEWRVYCLDLKTGKPLWQSTVRRAVPAQPIHLKNSYASETPVTDGEHVYALFGNVGLFCLDMDGQAVWSHEIEPRAMRYGWGTAASPVLHDDRIYLINDNEEASYLLALHKRTGQVIWKADRPDEKSNWAPPFVWQTPQRTEIVTPGTNKVRSYDLDGNLLWSLEGMSGITIARPYTAHDLLYVTSGYIGDRTRPIYAIRPGATGDISLTRPETTNTHIAWCGWTAAPYNPSTITYGRRLYVLYDRGLFACYNALTGASIFDRQRIPDANAFTASPWAADGKVYCISEDGVTFVFRDGDRFELLGTNKLAEDDMVLATPAIAGNRLLIRSSQRVYCIQP